MDIQSERTAVTHSCPFEYLAYEHHIPKLVLLQLWNKALTPVRKLHLEGPVSQEEMARAQ